MSLSYIGAWAGGATAVIVFVIVGVVVLALGYIVWVKAKNIFKKKK
jgi:Tfp pilus assembly protein PilO